MVEGQKTTLLPSGAQNCNLSHYNWWMTGHSPHPEREKKGSKDGKALATKRKISLPYNNQTGTSQNYRHGVSYAAILTRFIFHTYAKYNSKCWTEELFGIHRHKRQEDNRKIVQRNRVLSCVLGWASSEYISIANFREQGSQSCFVNMQNFVTAWMTYS